MAAERIAAAENHSEHLQTLHSVAHKCIYVLFYAANIQTIYNKQAYIREYFNFYV